MIVRLSKVAQAKIAHAKVAQSLPVVFTLFAAILLFQNCSQTNFAQAPADSGVGLTGGGDDNGTNSGGGGGNSGGLNGGTGAGLIPVGSTDVVKNCQPQLNALTVPAKILFVVDESGSNFGEGGEDPTDPKKIFRSTSMQKFFNDYRTNPQFSWGLIGFSESSARPIIAANKTAVFSSDPVKVQAGLDAFATRKDGGYTPYKAALQAIQTLITKDLANDASAKYMIIFLSDGMPTDVKTVGELKGAVEAAVGTSGRVALTTVYYGNTSKEAANVMNSMAVWGKGQFIDTNIYPQGRDLNLSQVVYVPGVTCQ